MIQLVQFEMKKIWRSTYFKWLLLLLVVTVLAFYANTYANTVSIDTIFEWQQEGQNDPVIKEYMLTLIGIVYFLFLFTDIVTKEGYYRNGPIQLLRSQPTKRYQILFVKLFTILFISIAIIGLILGLVTLLGLFFPNSVHWDNPILIYGESYPLTFAAIGLFLLKSLSLFFMLLLFSYSLLFLYSALTNRAFISLILTIITLFSGIQLVAQSFSFKFTQWIPFHYVNVFQIISNEYVLRHGQDSISYINGLLSLLTGSVIVLLLTLIVSKLKQGVVR